MEEVGGQEEERIDVEDEIFDVEKILAKDVVNGKVFYLIKWLGYTKDWNTWEPEVILSCPEKLKEFEDRLFKENKTESKSTQTSTQKCTIKKEPQKKTTQSKKPMTRNQIKDILPRIKEIRANQSNEKFVHFVFPKNSEETQEEQMEVLNYSDFKKKYPDVLFDFYERNMFGRVVSGPEPSVPDNPTSFELKTDFEKNHDDRDHDSIKIMIDL